MHHRPPALLLAFLASTAAAGAPALRADPGGAHLVADLDPRLPAVQSPYDAAGGDPQGWAALGGKAVFSATTEPTGFEPWVTDGTPAGTQQLADLCPGSCGGVARFVGIAHGVLFFVDESHGGYPALWRTDGTPAGTFRVAEQLGTPEVVLTADAAFFSGRDEAHGEEPWISDGTLAGTGPLVDIEPGSAPNSSYPRAFAIAGSRAVFSAGGALWSSDGSVAGTRKIFDAEARHAVSADGRAFVIAATYSEGLEVYATDGTTAGTRRLSHFAAAEPFSFNPAWRPNGAGLLFLADDGAHGIELYGTDGSKTAMRLSDTLRGPRSFAPTGPPAAARVALTAADAQGVTRLWLSGGGRIARQALSGCPGGCPRLGAQEALVAAGERVAFVGRDASGLEPWATDGTTAGTRRLADICPGTCDGNVRGLATHLGQAFFSAGPAPGDDELWATDGTTQGTRRVSSFVAPDPFSERFQRRFRGVSAGGRLFFGAEDPDWGIQPWVTDGTAAGTRLVSVLAPSGNGSRPHAFGAVPGGVAFAACDAERLRLFRSDGSAAGTLAIATPEPPATCPGFTVSDWVYVLVRGAQVFFLHTAAADPALWRVGSDGSGLTRLASLPDRSFGFTYPRPWGQAGVAFFTARGSVSGFELWTSDGTLGGTRANAMPAGLAYPDAAGLTAIGTRLYFTANVGGSLDGNGLWTSDGVGGEPVELAPLSYASSYASLGGVTYFIGANELWRTDGTPAGTARVFDDPDPYGTAHDLVTLGGKLYFAAGVESPTFCQGLWRSDGTTAGTVPIFQLPGRECDDYPRELTVAGSRLFFRATEGLHGSELWSSDGTTAGTRLVRDVVPGTASSFPRSLTPHGNDLFFIAADARHGYELWQSDGTAAGTRLVHDIAPGASSGEPAELTISAGQLFFAADDALHGREPWAVPVATASACTPAPTRLCLLGGRYAVEATWRDHAGRSGVGTAAPLGADTGTFWFFDDGNLEIAVKVLDGTPINGHRWVFYGALSDVEYTLTVTDTATGAVRRYFNPRGVLASVGDTSAFGPLGATAGANAAAATRVASLTSALPRPLRRKLAPAATCTPAPERLCFGNGRFAATVRWQAFDGSTGGGRALPLAGDTGAFWFFGADNVELLLKVLDGTPVNGHWWVYFGALSNVEYWVTVLDTATGSSVEYHNPAGRFASVADTAAFPR